MSELWCDYSSSSFLYLPYSGFISILSDSVLLLFRHSPKQNHPVISSGNNYSILVKNGAHAGVKFFQNQYSKAQLIFPNACQMKFKVGGVKL